MKKILSFLMLGALVAFTSCAKDNLTTQTDEPSSDLYSLSVSTVTSGGTRAVQEEPAPEINGNKLRYILEIYNNNKIFQRIVQNSNEFNFRLITNQTYDFLVWVDYAPEVVNDVSNDLHYVTNSTHDENGIGGLKNITMVGDYANNDHCRDAFFAVAKGVESGNTAKVFDNIVCKRPFGQLNIATTDWEHTYGADGSPIAALTPKKVQIIFEAHSAFNVYEEDVVGDKGTITYSESQSVISTHPSLEYRFDLTCDYIFAPKANILVNPRVDFYADGADVPFTHTDILLANIPIQRNYKTNVYGNLLTKKGQVTVDVDPEWNTPDIVVPVGIEDLQSELNKLTANSPESVYFHVTDNGSSAVGQFTFKIPSALGVADCKVKNIYITFDALSQPRTIAMESAAGVEFAGNLILTASKASVNNNLALSFNHTPVIIKGSWNRIFHGSNTLTFLRNITISAGASLNQLSYANYAGAGFTHPKTVWNVECYGYIHSARASIGDQPLTLNINVHQGGGVRTEGIEANVVVNHVVD